MTGLANTSRTLGWGVYCACSWTWCIGMFLPIIMLRDWGWPGFLVFAIPNVLGCAAFGYVLKTRARSTTLLARHGWAAIAFSIITIAFHLYFAGFLTMRLGDDSAAMPMLRAVSMALLVFVAGSALSALPVRAWPVTALIVYGVSISAFVSIGVEPLAEIPWRGDRNPIELWHLAPAIIFGFLLCPYLDLTFHRALQSSPSHHTFAVFGITFAVMIVLTCLYGRLSDVPIDGDFFDNDRAAAWLVGHLMAQMIFTIAVHIRELRVRLREMPHSELLSRSYPSLWPLASLALITVAAILQWSYATNEEVYIRFLAFYGLVFPAYVLVFIGPWKPKAHNRANLIRFTIILLALAPMYELGFIHGWTGVVLVAVAVLLGIVWMTPGTTRPLRQSEE